MQALHSRYTFQAMAELWSDEHKFETWLAVELAFLEGRVAVGDLSANVVAYIRAAAKTDVQRIAELEAVNDHDLLAFVEQVRESFDGLSALAYAGDFHTGLTSYDVEDPALMLTMRESLKHIIQAEHTLMISLVRRAQEHQWTLMIARTHGQYAEPTTFGTMLLEFARAVERDLARLQLSLHEVSVGKMSGAVGVYGDISPLVEEHALGVLGLNAQMSTQILGRDTHATVLNTLAVAAGTIERIAATLWQMARSDVGELHEPRKPKQKGSSAMAHKLWNPIKLEQLQGLSRLVRAYAHAAVENIASVEGRDISQSSVERHIIPGAMALTHYLAVTMDKIVRGLVVHADVMETTLKQRTLGVWASQRIRNRLIAHGVEPEVAYGFLQGQSFAAMDQNIHLAQVLSQAHVPCTTKTVREFLTPDIFDHCFDPRSYVERGVEHLFDPERMPGRPTWEG